MREEFRCGSLASFVRTHSTLLWTYPLTQPGIRDDKSPDMSTTPEQVASMYRAQAMATQSARGKDDEDEFW